MLQIFQVSKLEKLEKSEKSEQESGRFGRTYIETTDSALDSDPMPDEFRLIPTNELVEPPTVLREVRQGSVEYLEMRDSLAAHGFLNSICVRPSSRTAGKFEIVDGLYRWTAAVELRIPAVPCIIKYDLTDVQVLTMQISANAVRPTTTKSEFARQVRRVLQSNAGMTMAELAQTLHKSPTWIRWLLLLNNLEEPEKRAVDRGEMTLEAAYYLAKLPQSIRPNFVIEAKVLPLAEFRALAVGVLSQYRVAVRQGRLEALYSDFNPRPYLRSMKDLWDEQKSFRVGPNLITVSGAKTAAEGWKLAMDWILHLDAASIERTRARHQRAVKSFQPRRQENSHDVKSATDGTEAAP